MTLALSGRVVDSMDEAEYHAHPALSSTGVRKLLPPSTPAAFRWWRDHPEPPTDDMLLGTCFHTEVLGVGQGWEVVAGDRRTKEVKAKLAEVEAAGRIALKPSDAERIRAMVRAVREHPDAGPLLAPGSGAPERALFWRDEATGVECRALLDWSRFNRRAILDLKSTRDAWPGVLPRTVATYGYAIQAAFYLRGARALGLADEATVFVFVFVEKDPPYGVSVARIDRDDLEWADTRVSRALEIYRDCTQSGIWPGLPTGITVIRLPPWAKRDEDEEW